MYQEWRRQTLPGIIRYGVQAWPEKTAILYGNEKISYRELAERIARVRGGLQLAGIGRGDHVSYLLTASPRWLEVFFAVLELGAILVPLNLTWTTEEIAQGLRLTDTAFLLVGSTHKGESLPSRVAPLVDKVRSASLPCLRKVVVVEDVAINGNPSLVSLDSLIAQVSHEKLEVLADAVSPDDIAMLILTSGSTSFPKPAIHTHETILCGSASYGDGLEAGPNDVFLHCMPNYHVGSIDTACLTLIRGGTLRLMGAFEPGEAMRLIQHDRATLFWGFDTHLLMMRDHPSYGQYDLSSLERTMVAANPATFEKIREMGFLHIGNLYGSTEYMGSQTYFPYRDRHAAEKMKNSNGRAMSGEIRVADPETGQWLNHGEIGEICVRGPALFKGYYKQPEATAASMDAEGFFHSGDLGFLDEDQYLYYRGRLKEMVKSGGENVSALEVEMFLLSEIPGVSRAMICGTPHEKWGEAVTALLEVSGGFTYTEEDIQSRCRGRLASYKVPKRVLFVDPQDWSVTPTGKLDRKALVSLALTHFTDISKQ